MRLLKYHVAATVDGYIAHPDGSFDGFPMEGDHVDDFISSLGSYDAVLMGTKTYEVGLKVGVTDPYPPLKPYVFSRSITEPPDPRVELVAEDAVGFVRGLKSQPGKDVWLCGGGKLASTLLDAQLVDEIIVKLNPRLFGKGISLIGGGDRVVALELRDSKVYDTGVVLLTYGVNYADSR